MDRNKIAVISTGNGGQSMAAFFSKNGFDVALYAREQERIDMFHSNRFVMSGAIHGSTYIKTLSCDMGEVIENAYLIMVTTPAQYHSIVARDMAPHLKDGQIVVLNPGRTFGTHEFDKTLRDNGCAATYILAETETFAFTCRVNQIGYPIIYRIKENVLVASHEPGDIDLVMDALRPALPCFVPAKSVLHTGLTNIGMIFHPMPLIMNLTRVERAESFLHYIDGITPLVAGRLEFLDEERIRVAEALGIEVPTVMEWLADRYGSTGVNLYDAIQHTDAYADVQAPTDIYSRYVFEDIPTGCVPLVCAAERLGVETPIAKSLIVWASAIYGFDFYGRGRNDKRIDFSFLD